jgi:hypothetical protein
VSAPSSLRAGVHHPQHTTELRKFATDFATQLSGTGWQGEGSGGTTKAKSAEKRGLEAQAFSGREIGGHDDVLDFLVGHFVDVDLTRQPAS